MPSFQQFGFGVDLKIHRTFRSFLKKKKSMLCKKLCFPNTDLYRICKQAQILKRNHLIESNPYILGLYFFILKLTAFLCDILK